MRERERESEGNGCSFEKQTKIGFFDTRCQMRVCVCVCEREREREMRAGGRQKMLSLPLIPSVREGGFGVPWLLQSKQGMLQLGQSHSH